MFFWLVMFFGLLGGLVYWHSIRADKRRHKEKLRLIRKQIEENEKKKLIKKLNEGNRNPDHRD